MGGGGGRSMKKGGNLERGRRGAGLLGGLLARVLGWSPVPPSRSTRSLRMWGSDAAAAAALSVNWRCSPLHLHLKVCCCLCRRSAAPLPPPLGNSLLRSDWLSLPERSARSLARSVRIQTFFFLLLLLAAAAA